MGSEDDLEGDPEEKLRTGKRRKSKCFNCGYQYPLTMNKKGYDRFGHRFICFNCLVKLFNDGEKKW